MATLHQANNKTFIYTKFNDIMVHANDVIFV